MGKYFGTDGFRGEANVVLTVEHAFKVGRYLGWYFGQDHKARVVIGKDTRRSSYMFEYALAAGITASGADAYLLHVTTTPSVSYVVRSDDFDCGIMISASHNPFYDNGIKVINSAGHKMEAEVEEKIEAYIDGEIGELPLATKENIGRTIDYSAGRNRYIGSLISVATRSFKDMRIGLDCANGSSFAIAKSVFDALGAKTYVINNEPDGLNINTDCGSTHIHVLQEFVKENPAYPGGYLWLLEELLADNRLDEAENTCRALAKVDHSCRVAFYLGRICWKRGRHQEAEDIWHQMLEDHRDDWLTFACMADAMAHLCRYDDAVFYYRKAQELQPSPKYTDAQITTAMIYEIQGKYDDAIDSLNEQLEMLKQEWNLTEGCEVERVHKEISRLQQKSAGCP